MSSAVISQYADPPEAPEDASPPAPPCPAPAAVKAVYPSAPCPAPSDPSYPFSETSTVEPDCKSIVLAVTFTT